MVNIPSVTAYPVFYPLRMSKRHASFAYVKRFAETTFAKNTSEANFATKTPPTILCCIFQVLNWSYLIWLNQNSINPYILFAAHSVSLQKHKHFPFPTLPNSAARFAIRFAPGIGSQFCKGLGQVPRGSPRGPLGVQRRGSWASVRVLARADYQSRGDLPYGWPWWRTTGFPVVFLSNQPKWVCLKMLCTPKPNGFADHYPVFKWLFHWEYALFSDKPKMLRFLEVSCFIRYHGWFFRKNWQKQQKLTTSIRPR